MLAEVGQPTALARGGNGHGPAVPSGVAIDSHLVGEAARIGWETRRCQITAQSPSVCGVIVVGR